MITCNKLTINCKSRTTNYKPLTNNYKLITNNHKPITTNYLLILLLLFLLACSQDLPPSPPDPGSVAGVGSAIGGIQLSPEILPSWAAPLEYTDITPNVAKEGDVLRVTVSKKYNNTDKKFYVHAAVYVYNKDSRVWERFIADVSSSGKIVKKWAEGNAAFLVPVSSPRFSPGKNFLIVYWCIDAGLKDGQGFKIWNCNGRKWGLGAFELQGSGFPNILIERDIGSDKYVNSSQRSTPDGVEYEALYKDGNAATSVKVTQLSNLSGFKQSLAPNIALLETLWTPKNNTCGFFQEDQVKFTWLSGSTRVVVQSSGDLDQEVSAYSLRYASNCGLLDELRTLSGVGRCGDGKCGSNESTSVCPADCPPESNPPNITIVTPSNSQIFNTSVITYAILASDESGVASCKASTDTGPQEIMTGVGGVWKLTKFFFSGNHTVVVECVDQRSITAVKSVSFFVLPINQDKNVNSPGTSIVPVLPPLTPGDIASLTNSSAAKSAAQTCVIKVLAGFVDRVRLNPSIYCWDPPAFVNRFTRAPFMTNPLPVGVFDEFKTALNCTVSCNVEVGSKCLEELDPQGITKYTSNSVVNWVCGSYKTCSSTIDCGVSETCMQGLCRSS